MSAAWLQSLARLIRRRIGGDDDLRIPSTPMSSSDPREGTHYQFEAVTNFALIGSQRSGTNFLRELLNTNQHVVVHGEVLWPYPLPNCWHNYVRTMVNRAMPPVYAKDAMDLVDDYFVYMREDVKRGYAGKAGSLAAVGFDLKYNQLRFIAPLIRDLRQPPFMLDYFHRRGIPVVHMVRRNVIQQALSLVIADVRNIYHNYGGKKTEDRVALDPEKLLASARWVAAELEAFRKLATGLRMFEIHYEDAADACNRADAGGALPQDDRAMAALAEFLRVPNSFSRPATLRKVIDRPYSEVIENHADVVTAVRKSEFSQFAKSI